MQNAKERGTVLTAKLLAELAMPKQARPQNRKEL